MNVILHLQDLEKILLNQSDTFVNDILGHLNNCKIVHIGQKGHTSDSSKRSYQHLSINYSAALVHCKDTFMKFVYAILFVIHTEIYSSTILL